MSLVTIDHTLCRRDGICRAVCPMNLFEEDNERFPVFRNGAEQNCIACGHCVAVCPTGALGHEQLPLENAPLIDHSLTASAVAVDQLIKGRRSIREFSDEPVGKTLVEEIIDASRFAPSAINRQPVEWLIVHTPAEVKRLAGLVVEYLRKCGDIGPRYAQIVDLWDQGGDPILRNAPHLVLVHAPKEWVWSTVDCTIALTQFEMSAVAHGFGTCWAGFLMWAAREHPPIGEALGLPAGNGVFGALMFGLPRYRYHRFPPREQARIEWR